LYKRDKFRTGSGGQEGYYALAFKKNKEAFLDMILRPHRMREEKYIGQRNFGTKRQVLLLVIN
jgi:hypothetical protein